MTGMGR